MSVEMATALAEANIDTDVVNSCNSLEELLQRVRSMSRDNDIENANENANDENDTAGNSKKTCRVKSEGIAKDDPRAVAYTDKMERAAMHILQARKKGKEFVIDPRTCPHLQLLRDMFFDKISDPAVRDEVPHSCEEYCKLTTRNLGSDMVLLSAHNIWNNDLEKVEEDKDDKDENDKDNDCSPRLPPHQRPALDGFRLPSKCSMLTKFVEDESWNASTHPVKVALRTVVDNTGRHLYGYRGGAEAISLLNFVYMVL